MPARVLPDNDELQHLIERHGVEQVALMYGVTRQAVYATLERAGLQHLIEKRQHSPYKKWIPWVIPAKHCNTFLHNQLRNYARRQLKKPLSDAENRYLDRFLADIKKRDVVIHFDRNMDPPWMLVPRRKGVDRGIIRKADL